MRASSKNAFASSRNSVMQGIVNTGSGPAANYEQNKIFIGWKIGDKEEYEEFLDQKWREYGELNPDVYREALRLFQRHVQNKDPEDYEEFFLDQESASVIFRPGERGAGKSFFMRAESNRSSKSGVLNIIVDPAHEYYTNNFKGGIQNKLKNLRREETPQQIDTKVLMPRPVKKARDMSEMGDAGMQFSEVFKFSFDDLDPNDITYLIMKDVKPSTKDARRQDLQVYTSRLNTLIERGEIHSFRDCEELAKRMANAGRFRHDERDTEITNKLEKYKKWEFLGEGYDIGAQDEDNDEGLLKVLQDYNSVVLCLADDDNIPDRLEIKQLYLAFLIKKVRSLKKSGQLDKKVQWVIDEIHRFLLSSDPDDVTDAPPAHREIRKIIKEDRKIGFRLSMSSQEVGDIPERNFLKQTDHMFLPMNIDGDTRHKLLDMYDIAQWADKQRNKWITIFGAMDEYQWFYVRKKTKNWALIQPASPLSYHMTED